MQRKTSISHGLHTVCCEYCTLPLSNTDNPAWPHKSRRAQIQLHMQENSHFMPQDQNQDEMRYIKDAVMTAWYFIDHKPFLVFSELWIIVEMIIYFCWSVLGAQQQWVWQRRRCSKCDTLKKKIYPLSRTPVMILDSCVCIFLRL